MNGYSLPLITVLEKQRHNPPWTPHYFFSCKSCIKILDGGKKGWDQNFKMYYYKGIKPDCFLIYLFTLK